jgi:hypothetical protein
MIMATLKAQNFELNFSYYNLNNCNEIEYSFDIKLNGKSFFNPDILSKTAYSVKKGMFIFSDCLDDKDWLHTFFINILKTRKGGTVGTIEPPEWHFSVITWEDRRPEKEKSWEGKTCAVGHPDGTISHEPYAETMKIFIPLWENDIEFKIRFPDEIFDANEYTTFELSLTTNFWDLTKFLEDFGKEMNEFYDFFDDRMEYVGNGKYQEKKDFKYKDCSLDKDLYMIKRCAEWNKYVIDSDEEIILKLLLEDIRWRNRAVGTARHLMESSITEDLAKKIFTLAEKKSTEEKDEETIKKLETVKVTIAIVLPNIFTNSQINKILSKAKNEDIPEEIFEKNKMFYPTHLQENFI